MADQGFHRADGRVFRHRPGSDQRRGHGFQFRLVARHRAGAMRLEQFHARRIEPRLRIGPAERPLLPGGQRRGQPLGAAIGRGSDPLDHRINPVAVAFGIGKPLQHHRRQTLGNHDPVGFLVKGVADAARAQRLGLGKTQITKRRLQAVDAARHHRIRPARFQLHHRRIDGGERRGAGGIDDHVRPAKVETVGHPPRRHIGQNPSETVFRPFRQLFQHRFRQRADQPRQFGAGHILRALLAHPPRKPEHHRGALTVHAFGRAIGGVFQRVGHQFQRQKLHRIDRVHRGRRNAVIQRVEGHVVQKAAPTGVNLVALGPILGEQANFRPAVSRHLPDGALPGDDPPPIG